MEVINKRTMHEVEKPTTKGLPNKKYQTTAIGLYPMDWKIITINDLVENNIIEKPMDGNHGNIHPTSKDYVDDGIPFIMANNIINSSIDLKNCKYLTIDRASKLQKGFSKTGDVLLTHKGTVGSTAIVGKISSNYIMLTPQVTYYRIKEQDRLSRNYLKHFFDSYQFQSTLKEYSGGGTRAYIGITSQRKLPFVLPPLPEQKAIAQALSDVDDLISALDALIEKKRNIKQGTMQELLTGKRRLPGFSGGWEEKEIKDIADVKGGKRLPKGRELITNETAQPYIRVADMYEGGVHTNDIKYVPNDIIPIISNYRIYKDDLFISVAGTLGIVGEIPTSLNGANLTENA